VSRYTLTLKPVNESWYTKCKMITCGYPGLCISSYYKKEQARFAKTVTNNLPILSVLAAVFFLILEFDLENKWPKFSGYKNSIPFGVIGYSVGSL
jgi:hypothetical protein